MALEDDVIEIVNNYLRSLQQRRINELVGLAADDPLSLDDIFPFFQTGTSKTKRTTLQRLKEFMISPDGQVLNPEQIGSSIVVVAGPAEWGTDTFNIPALAGKEFLLRKVGYGTMKWTADSVDYPGPKQYEMLSSGGFKLLEGMLIQGGTPESGEICDQFELQLVDANMTPLPGAAGSLFKGSVVISTSVTLNQENHLNRLLQIRPAAMGKYAKLPNVDDVEENTLVWFEAMINCPYEFEINTSGGQYIYANGTSYSRLIIRKGESGCLFRGADGWYVIYISPSVFQVGMILDGYNIGLNEQSLIGNNTISAAANIRFTEWMMSLPDSVVDIATRNTAEVYEKEGAWYTIAPTPPYNTILKPYRGFFGRDPDGDNIVLPDFTDMFTRSLGTDATQRYQNVPGGYQKDEMKSFEITLPLHRTNNNYGYGVLNGPIIDTSDEENNVKVNVPGGPENRGQNIGLIKKIKL